MAINPIVYTEKIVRSFLKYQLSAYPFADPRLHGQMRKLLSIDQVRRTPLLHGPYISLSRGFREGASIQELIDQGVFHPHMRHIIPPGIVNVYGHQERAIRAVHAGRSTLVSTGTGRRPSAFYPIISKCSTWPTRRPSGHRRRDRLSDERPGRGPARAAPRAVGRQRHRLRHVRGQDAGEGARSGRPPHDRRLHRADSRPCSDYRDAGRPDAVHPAEEACSRKADETAGGQPCIL